MNRRSFRLAAVAALIVSLAALVVAFAQSQSMEGPFGFGQPATAERIAAWDIDVRPDGTGLPAGSGTPAQGAEIFAAKCAGCHGETGVEGPMPRLVGVYDPDDWPGQPRTIGNYWPYATIVYDFINRSMPFLEPKSLTPDEVYSLTAWLLYRNEIIAEDAIMDATTLPQVQMPALEKWVHQDLRDTWPFR